MGRIPGMNGFVSRAMEFLGPRRGIRVMHPSGAGGREAAPKSAYSCEVSGIGQINWKTATSLDVILEFVYM
jgi:hypothetical protein